MMYRIIKIACPVYFTLHLMCFGCNALWAQFEGRILYDVEYFTDDVELKGLIDQFPKQSELIISGGNARFQQVVSGDATQIFISSGESDKNILVLNFLGEPFKVVFSREEMSQLETNTSLAVVKSPETKNIHGFHCRMAFSVHNGDTLSFYYNSEIYDGNLLPQFMGIEGLVLEYESVQNGLHMRFKAKELTLERIDDDWFDVSDEIREVSFDDFAKSFALIKKS